MWVTYPSVLRWMLSWWPIKTTMTNKQWSAKSTCVSLFYVKDRTSMGSACWLIPSFPNKYLLNQLFHVYQNKKYYLLAQQEVLSSRSKHIAALWWFWLGNQYGILVLPALCVQNALDILRYFLHKSDILPVDQWHLDAGPSTHPAWVYHLPSFLNTSVLPPPLTSSAVNYEHHDVNPQCGNNFIWM